MNSHCPWLKSEASWERNPSPAQGCTYAIQTTVSASYSGSRAWTLPPSLPGSISKNLEGWTAAQSRTMLHPESCPWRSGTKSATPGQRFLWEWAMNWKTFSNAWDSSSPDIWSFNGLQMASQNQNLAKNNQEGRQRQGKEGSGSFQMEF